MNTYLIRSKKLINNDQSLETTKICKNICSHKNSETENRILEKQTENSVVGMNLFSSSTRHVVVSYDLDKLRPLHTTSNMRISRGEAH
jgi:hypothetical protein